MIQPSRIQFLNDSPEKRGDYVLYWMQQSQRVHFNHALAFALKQANRLRLPLLVWFGLTDGYPGANLRHYNFMIQGLLETSEALADMGIRMIISPLSPEVGVVKASKNAALVVTDLGYTRIQKLWRKKAAENLATKFIQVESDVLIPVETASDKQEYGAYTLRPKIRRLLDEYLYPLSMPRPLVPSLEVSPKLPKLTGNLEAVLRKLKINRSVGPAPEFSGGYKEAKKRLQFFLQNTLPRYEDERNDPNSQAISNLSPYLHFGQISALEIALAAMKAGEGPESGFLEELIIRRELAVNFLQFNESYDSLDCLPDWAQKTLDEHRIDMREYTYSKAQWEAAKTHDPYWNAAQIEMVTRGKMHGYMRMYWGKKILEWSETPEEAFETALYLNDKYELDGRDPNGYAGIAWCFGLHDRAWSERPVFGKIRYMNAAGLRRKFKIDQYVNSIATDSGNEITSNSSNQQGEV